MVLVMEISHDPMSSKFMGLFGEFRFFWGIGSFRYFVRLPFKADEAVDAEDICVDVVPSCKMC